MSPFANSSNFASRSSLRTALLVATLSACGGNVVVDGIGSGGSGTGGDDNSSSVIVGPGQGPAGPGQGPSGPGQGPSGPGQGPSGPGQGPAGPGQGPTTTGYGGNVAYVSYGYGGSTDYVSYGYGGYYDGYGYGGSGSYEYVSYGYGGGSDTYSYGYGGAYPNGPTAYTYTAYASTSSGYNCASCADVVQGNGSADQFCPGSYSADLYYQLYECVCVSGCEKQCNDGCNGGNFSNQCQNCLYKKCGNELKSCISDQ